MSGHIEIRGTSFMSDEERENLTDLLKGGLDGVDLDSDPLISN